MLGSRDGSTVVQDGVTPNLKGDQDKRDTLGIVGGANSNLRVRENANESQDDDATADASNQQIRLNRLFGSNAKNKPGLSSVDDKHRVLGLRSLDSALSFIKASNDFGDGNRHKDSSIDRMVKM